MAQRSGDWFAQAEHDFAHAQAAAREGRFDWACFAAHQAAEKAVNALHLHHRQEVRGRVVASLLQQLPVEASASPDLVDAAKVLDAFYIPTRYPDSHPDGPPFSHNGRFQGEEAIRHAGSILGFVRAALASG